MNDQLKKKQNIFDNKKEVQERVDKDTVATYKR